MDFSDLEIGKQYKVFDYGNDIFDIIVTIIEINTYDDYIIYQTDKETIWFSNQGFFENI